MNFDFSGKRYNYTSWDGRRPIYKYIEALDRTVSSDLIGNSSNYDSNGKKSNRLRLTKQQLCTCINLTDHARMLYYLLRLDNDNTSQLIAKYAHLMFQK